MRNQIIIALSFFVMAGFVRAQNTNSALPTEKDQVSYAIGCNIGMNLQRQGYDVDPDLIARGIRDILETNKTAMTEAEAMHALQSYHQKLMQKRQQEEAAAAAKNEATGAAWLAENAKKEGVVALDSGLQYKVLTQGSGDAIDAKDTVRVNYRGTLIDGTEFDSSYSRGRPAEFKVTRVIPGWTQALEKMRVGDKWELFVPAKLAYGDHGHGPKIPPGSTLIFQVEVLGVTKPQEITSDIIKVPSAEEMKKGATIETIKASDLKRIQEEANKAKENEKK